MVTMVCGNEGRDGDEGGFGNGAPPSSEWRREGGSRGGSGGGSEGGKGVAIAHEYGLTQ